MSKSYMPSRAYLITLAIIVGIFLFLAYGIPSTSIEMIFNLFWIGVCFVAGISIFFIGADMFNDGGEGVFFGIIVGVISILLIAIGIYLVSTVFF